MSFKRNIRKSKRIRKKTELQELKELSEEILRAKENETKNAM